MTDVTRILLNVESGDREAAEELFSIVYEELRRLAKSRMVEERPDHTLQATALVHEAFMRLVDVEHCRRWKSRKHFFVSAAEAMRRILVDHARSRRRQKRGGERQRTDLDETQLTKPSYLPQLLAIDELLDELANEDATAADLTKMRYYVGMSTKEAGEALGISRAVAFRKWALARAWLQCKLVE